MASPNDLVSLVNAKLWLGATTTTNDDAMIAIIISAASQMIMGYLGRASLLPRAYVEVRDPNKWHDSIMLRQWPIISVSSLTINGKIIPVALVETTLTSPQAGYLVEQADQTPPGRPSSIYLQGICPGWARQSVVIDYSAGYQVSAEPWVISGPSYSVSAQQPYGYWASDTGVQYAATGKSLTAVSGTPAQGQYSLAAGVYTFSAADAGATVLLNYGYVPFAVSEVCMELVGERMKYRMRIGSSAKTLGGQETIQFTSNSMPMFLKEALAPYRARFTPQ